MTSPPSPQPKQWKNWRAGLTLNDGVFSSWKGHRPFSEPAAGALERDVPRHDVVDPRLLAHLGDVVVANPACHAGESTGAHPRQAPSLHNGAGAADPASGHPGRTALVHGPVVWEGRSMTASTERQRVRPSQTLGALVHQLSQQIPELIRSEIRLAQAEVTEKGKRAGVGIGMFSVAGLLGFFALAPSSPPRSSASRYVVDAWLAALIVALVLLAAAAVAGLVGKNKVAEAGPPAPERAIQGLKDDIATVKGDHHG